MFEFRLGWLLEIGFICFDKRLVVVCNCTRLVSLVLGVVVTSFVLFSLWVVYCDFTFGCLIDSDMCGLVGVFAGVFWALLDLNFN